MFTGVSSSGKSSIVFDTIAAESQQQMSATYLAAVKGEGTWLPAVWGVRGKERNETIVRSVISCLRECRVQRR